MTSEQFRNRSFAVSRRGYDRDEVDRFLEDAAASHQDLARRVEQLEAELQRANEAAPAAVSSDPVEAYRSLGEKTTAILVQAEEAAAELRSTAAADAAREREHAEAYATATRTAADEHDRATRAAADEYDRATRADADGYATTVRTAAEDHRTTTHNAADAYAATTRGDADEYAAQTRAAADEDARTTRDRAARQAEADLAAADRAARELVEAAQAEAARLVAAAEDEHARVTALAESAGDARDVLVTRLREVMQDVESRVGPLLDLPAVPDAGEAGERPAPGGTQDHPEPPAGEGPARPADASTVEAPAPAATPEQPAVAEAAMEPQTLSDVRVTHVFEVDDVPLPAGVVPADDDEGAVDARPDRESGTAEVVDPPVASREPVAPEDGPEGGSVEPTAAQQEPAGTVAAPATAADDAGPQGAGVPEDVQPPAEGAPVAAGVVADPPRAPRGVDTAVARAAADAAAAVGRAGPAPGVVVDADGRPDPMLLRERSLAAVRPGMLRGLRRGLQDLQTAVLAGVRDRGEGVEADDLLPADTAGQQLVELAEPFLEAAHRAGRGDAPVLLGEPPDPDADVDATRTSASALALAVLLVDTVRTTLRPSLAAGLAAGEPGASLSERVGEVFRDMKGPVVEAAVEQQLVEAYGTGALLAWSEDERVAATRWVVGQESRCPEGACRANAEQGPVALLGAYPSGQVAPPVHDGCTCALSPIVAA